MTGWKDTNNRSEFTEKAKDLLVDPDYYKQHRGVCGIGVRCGEKFVVLDADSKDEAFNEFIEKYHTRLTDICPFICQTPTGGYHYYFKNENDFSNGPLYFMGKLLGDWKTGNSYVCSPPTIHPNGGKYKWLKKFPTDSNEDVEYPSISETINELYSSLKTHSMPNFDQKAKDDKNKQINDKIDLITKIYRRVLGDHYVFDSIDGANSIRFTTNGVITECPLCKRTHESIGNIPYARLVKDGVVKLYCFRNMVV